VSSQKAEIKNESLVELESERAWEQLFCLLLGTDKTEKTKPLKSSLNDDVKLTQN